MVEGQLKRLLVHRKGSTRAFGPHHPLIPVDYQLTGQPVLIGGTMGTHSYVLTGACLSRFWIFTLWKQYDSELEGSAFHSIVTLQTSSAARQVQVMSWLAFVSLSLACERVAKSIKMPCLTCVGWMVCGRHRAGDGGDLWQHLPRRRQGHQPQQLQAAVRLHQSNHEISVDATPVGCACTLVPAIGGGCCRGADWTCVCLQRHLRQCHDV